MTTIEDLITLGHKVVKMLSINVEVLHVILVGLEDDDGSSSSTPYY